MTNISKTTLCLVNLITFVAQDRIVGGAESEKYMYPWQCGLVKKKRNFIWFAHILTFTFVGVDRVKRIKLT